MMASNMLDVGRTIPLLFSDDCAARFRARRRLEHVVDRGSTAYGIEGRIVRMADPGPAGSASFTKSFQNC